MREWNFIICIVSEFLEKIHPLDSNSDPVPKQAINKHNKSLRFLGDTPTTIFINVLSIVSNIMTVWGFIETREDAIEKKKMKKLKEEEETSEYDQTEVLEELNRKLEGIHSGITEEMEHMKRSFKQLTCRFDAVHAKSKSISQECLKFIRPLNQPTHNKAIPLEAELPHYKINHVQKTNFLSSYEDHRVNGWNVSTIFLKLLLRLIKYIGPQVGLYDYTQMLTC